MSLLLRYNETLIKIYYTEYLISHRAFSPLLYSSMIQIKESAEIQTLFLES